MVYLGNICINTLQKGAKMMMMMMIIIIIIITGAECGRPRAGRIKNLR
jgi:hypothetical protein